MFNINLVEKGHFYGEHSLSCKQFPEYPSRSKKPIIKHNVGLSLRYEGSDTFYH